MKVNGIFCIKNTKLYMLAVGNWEKKIIVTCIATDTVIVHISIYAHPVFFLCIFIGIFLKFQYTICTFYDFLLNNVL